MNKMQALKSAAVVVVVGGGGFAIVDVFDRRADGRRFSLRTDFQRR